MKVKEKHSSILLMAEIMHYLGCRNSFWNKSDTPPFTRCRIAYINSMGWVFSLSQSVCVCVCGCGSYKLILHWLCGTGRAGLHCFATPLDQNRGHQFWDTPIYCSCFLENTSNNRQYYGCIWRWCTQNELQELLITCFLYKIQLSSRVWCLMFFKFDILSVGTPGW